MRILVLGKNGQVGWELNRSLQPLGEIIALGREDANFAEPESLRNLLHELKPDIIVNAVAYTAVDKAEGDEELATIVNSIAPGVLAEESFALNALLIHYSTDYVFDGTKKSAYNEVDIPNPINAYGRTKLAGEQAIQASGCDHLIFRTSWVYASRGHNFLLTMLRLAKEREELSIVADQYGAPTCARTIADITAQVLTFAQRERQVNTFLSGIYHLTSSGKTSWYGFSDAIIKRARQFDTKGVIITERVLPIATEDYPVSAPRPKYSQLDSACLVSRFGLVMPDWHDVMKLCIDEVLNSQ